MTAATITTTRNGFDDIPKNIPFSSDCSFLYFHSGILRKIKNFVNEPGVCKSGGRRLSVLRRLLIVRADVLDHSSSLIGIQTS